MTEHAYSASNGELVLEDANSRVALSGARLRRQCRCAQCRALALRGESPVVSAEVRVVAVAPMGYGVQIHFSDGHDRGVFPWRYLADIAAGLAA